MKSVANWEIEYLLINRMWLKKFLLLVNKTKFGSHLICVFYNL